MVIIMRMCPFFFSIREEERKEGERETERDEERKRRRVQK
jgi:hypothetical protein